jgi:hypothetical protein
MWCSPRIHPMRLRLVREPFDHPDRIFELKHDGFRALTRAARITYRSCLLGKLSGVFRGVPLRYLALALPF